MEFESKLRILQGIAECVPENGSGEDEKDEDLLQNFLPLRSYAKLADPKTFLITGGRGAGKTELFRILTSSDGLNHIISEKDRRRYTVNLSDSLFVTGYITTGVNAKQFPAAYSCDELLEKENPENLTAFWGGLVCAVLLRKFGDDPEIGEAAKTYLGDEITKILENVRDEVWRWWSILDSDKGKWESFLDQADDILGQKGIRLCFVYDELDRICSNYDKLFGFIRAILDFWYRHNSRFTNMKAKIFLRRDLYNAKALQFVDASKMGAYRLELNWNTVSLYRLLVKRMANAKTDGQPVQEMTAYLRDIPGLLQVEANPALGYMPGDSVESFKKLIVQMVGEYMGKPPKKGRSYDWVPNHVQDGNGEVAPRPFLKCFAFAAQDMLENRKELEALDGNKLLTPSSLQGALTKASQDRVNELISEEYQWLESLIDRLRGKTMLMGREEFLTYLQPENWAEDDRKTLPGKTGEMILETLLTLGIVTSTSDGRINVPDIYLHGFGLKRKGGIKRTR